MKKITIWKNPTEFAGFFTWSEEQDRVKFEQERLKKLRENYEKYPNFKRKQQKLQCHGPKRCGGTVVDKLFDEVKSKKGKVVKFVEIGLVCSHCGKVYYAY